MRNEGHHSGYASMKKLKSTIAVLFLIAAILSCAPRNIHGAEGETPAEAAATEKPPGLTLVKALMCEGMEDLEPKNETIIFTTELKGATCFTAFDPVPKKTVIYHNWFKRDQPDKKLKLTLKPPKWSCFSKMRIRNAGTGPWRVEITDSDGKIFQTLRFSVTE